MALVEVERFADIEEEFTSRVRSMIWCSVATVDRRQRPYSRILHPLWEGKTGWILTHRGTHKAKHLERNPFVSLAYIRGDVQRPLYVDCRATWVEESDERKRIWNLAASEPPPLGFDPAPDFESQANPNFGVLKLSPWRIVLVTFPAASYDAGHQVWRDKTVC
jgi:general stress protein 26